MRVISSTENVIVIELGKDKEYPYSKDEIKTRLIGKEYPLILRVFRDRFELDVKKAVEIPDSNEFSIRKSTKKIAFDDMLIVNNAIRMINRGVNNHV